MRAIFSSTLTWVFAITALCSLDGYADSIILKSGARITGTIVIDNSEEVQIQTAGGRLAFSKAKVGSLEKTETEEPLDRPVFIKPASTPKPNDADLRFSSLKDTFDLYACGSDLPRPVELRWLQNAEYYDKFEATKSVERAKAQNLIKMVEGGAKTYGAQPKTQQRQSEPGPAPQRGSFLCFSVLRNGSVIGTTTVTEFLDYNPPLGALEYQVSAMFKDGTSIPSEKKRTEVKAIYMRPITLAEYVFANVNWARGGENPPAELLKILESSIEFHRQNLDFVEPCTSQHYRRFCYARQFCVFCNPNVRLQAEKSMLDINQAYESRQDSAETKARLAIYAASASQTSAEHAGALDDRASEIRDDATQYYHTAKVEQSRVGREGPPSAPVYTEGLEKVTNLKMEAKADKLERIADEARKDSMIYESAAANFRNEMAKELTNAHALYEAMMRSAMETMNTKSRVATLELATSNENATNKQNAH